ncbi:MAG TPA: hypothetical protein VFX20_19490 [Steroidobacteraceae bacterium]|nr:hypothetical protein [Steroidobacteraceae bacterium]
MELRVILNPISEPGPAKRLLSNLFYGCGYNFYRFENELLADDLLIRGKLSQLVRDCRAHLSSLEMAFLRDHRARTGGDYAFLSPAALTMAQALLSAQRHLQAMEAAIRSATLPESRHFQRHHRERHGTLEELVMLDGEVVLALVTLRDAVAKLDSGAAAAARMDELLRASDFRALWGRREALLAGGLA